MEGLHAIWQQATVAAGGGLDRLQEMRGDGQPAASPAPVAPAGATPTPEHVQQASEIVQKVEAIKANPDAFSPEEIDLVDDAWNRMEALGGAFADLLIPKAGADGSLPAKPAPGFSFGAAPAAPSAAHDFGGVQSRQANVHSVPGGGDVFSVPTAQPRPPVAVGRTPQEFLEGARVRGAVGGTPQEFLEGARVRGAVGGTPQEFLEGARVRGAVGGTPQEFLEGARVRGAVGGHAPRNFSKVPVCEGQ